jgi:hypothetical protein
MTHAKLTLATAAALVLLAAPAEAQGRRGRGDRKIGFIELLDGNGQKVTRAPQGGVLVFKGRNLHQCPKPKKDEKTGRPLPMPPCRHDEIKVKVGGKNATIFESTFDYVTFGIPQSTPPGKSVRVEVSVTGRGSATAKVEIVNAAEWKASAAERGSESGQGGVRENFERKALDSIKITRFEQVPTSAGNTFVLEGIAKGIPNRAEMQVDLKYDGQTIPKGTRVISVKEEAFSTTFGPYSKKLLYGNYSLELLFQLSNQSKRLRRKWERTLHDSQRQVYGRLQRRALEEHGTGPNGTVTKADRDKQAAQLKAHYLAFTTEVRKLRDDVRAVVADAGRSFFRKGREYDEAQYKTWLQRMGFASSPTKAMEINDKKKYGKASGHFNEQAYRNWAKRTLIPALQSLYKKHRSFNDQYICPMDEKADTLGDWLISIVLLRLQEWSKDLYAHSGVPLPDEIGQVPISPVKAPQLSRKFFDAKRRELMRRVGLGAEVEQELQQK